MTTTLEHTQRDQPGEHENLNATQARLINHTRWDDLLYDFAQPPQPDQDDYNRTLQHVPGFVNAVTGVHAPDNMHAARDYLTQTAAALNQYGYSRVGAIERTDRPPRHPNAELADYVGDWLKHTGTSRQYMSGRREDQAYDTFPLDQLKTLVAFSVRPNRLPHQIEDGLWAATRRIMTEYEAGIEADRHNRHYKMRVHGTESLEQYGLRPEQFTTLLREVQLSYPPELMLGVRTVNLSDQIYYGTSPNDRRSFILGEMDHGARRMDLFLRAHTLGKTDREFLPHVRGTIRHEFAHVAHFNAPVEWLRRWERLMKSRRISVSAYAEHAHRHHEDEGRGEDFAEIARVYQDDPMRLIYLSRDHFELVNELMQLYDTPSVRSAYEMSSTAIPIEDPRFVGVEQQLVRSRQRTYEQRLALISADGGDLGRISVVASDTHRGQHRRRAA